MAYFYDEYGNQRLVNPTYGSVPPLGTPVYEDDQPSLPATDLPQLPQFGQSPRPAAQRPSLGQPLSMQIPSLGLPEQVGNSPNYDGAPPQQIGSGVDPNNVPISPSMFGSSMFQTAEQEMDFNDAVRRGDSAKVRELIQQADKYAKDKAKRDAITNMVNTAVMAGLGIAAGAPGSYGDFGTQVARGALTGINYATAMQNQESLDDYRQGQLQNARARALSYQQQVENSRRNTDLKSKMGIIKVDKLANGTRVYGMTNPYTGEWKPLLDQAGRIRRPGPADTTKATTDGILVVDGATNEVTFLRNPATGEVAQQFAPPPYPRYDFQSGMMVDGSGVARPMRDEAGNALSGTRNPQNIPIEQNQVIDKLNGFLAEIPSKSPPEVQQFIENLKRELMKNPAAATPAYINDQIKIARQMVKDWSESPAGRMALLEGQVAGTSPLPAPANLGGLDPAPAATGAPPQAANPPQVTVAPPPPGQQFSVPQSQIDAVLTPAALGPANVPASDMAAKLVVMLGMTPEEAATAVAAFRARVR